MAAPRNTVLFDVHDFKVYPMTADSGASPTYGAAVDVIGIANVSLEPNIVSAELKGDARIIARRGRADKMTLSATYGKLSLDVLVVLLGGAVVDSGTGTDEHARYRLLGDNSTTYFKAECLITDLDVGVGSVRVILYKCAITGGTLLGQSTDEFGQPTMEIEAIPPESNDVIVDVFIDETETPLSS